MELDGNEFKRILVTGGCGYSASHVINHFLTKYPGYFILNVDRLDECSNKESIKPFTKEQYKFVHGDISCPYLIRFLLEEYEISYVMHFSANSSVCNSYENEIDHTIDNTLATHKLLRTCHQYGKIKLFIHVSTDEVYGDSDFSDNVKKTPESIFSPTNFYSASKCGAENICNAYKKSFNFPIIITRSNNIMGGGNQHVDKLIPKFINLLLDGKKCTIHGNGENLRSFIHVNDICSAFDIIFHKGKIGEIYNIEAGNEYSVNDVYKKIVNILGLKEEEMKQFIKDRPWNDKRYFVDGIKLRELGWKAEVDFEDGLRESIELFKEKRNKNNKV